MSLHAVGRVRGPACQRTAADEIRLPLADGLPDIQRLRSVAVQETESGSAEQGSHPLEARHAPDSPADFRNCPSKRRGSPGPGDLSPGQTAGDSKRPVGMEG